MQDPHTPRDGFVERLEWQISSELRRRHRTGPATWLPASPVKAAAVIAFLVIVSMAAGGAAVAAAVQAQNDARRDALTSGYEQRLELARRRLVAAQTHMQVLDREVKLGLLPPDRLSEPQLNVTEAEQSVKVLELQLQEVRLSAREPLSEISAPLVSGRDFVLERLQIERLAPELALVVERVRLKDGQARVRVGVAPAIEVAEIEARISELESAISGLQRKLDIRRQFVAGQITAAQADLRVLESAAEHRLRALEPKIAVARTKVAAEESRFNVGLTTRVEVAAARLRLSELESELAKAQLDLALIRKKINEPS
jgi:hypothetical protein